MPINTQIQDGSGGSVSAKVHNSEDDVAGLVVYSREYDNRIPRNKPFFNKAYGASMAQNGAFGGTPIGIHNGGDNAYWTGSNVSGSTVAFTSVERPNSGLFSVKVDSPNTNDVWQFAKGSDQILTNYSSFSFAVNIDNGWTSGDSVTVYGWDTAAGVQVGAAVMLEDYIDEFLFDTWQEVGIQFTDMGLEGATIDALRFEQFSTHGQAAVFFIDDLQIEESGGIIKFTVEPDTGKDFLIDGVRITAVNNVTGAAAREYNEFLGETMSSGIVISRLSRQKEAVGRNIATLYDFYNVGFNKLVLEEGATQSTLSIEIEFSPPVLLESQYGDNISLGVQDDLTGYTKLSAIARGKTEA